MKPPPVTAMRFPLTLKARRGGTCFLYSPALPRPMLKRVARGAALAVVGAAVAIPFLRRPMKLRAAPVMTVMVAAPLALAATRPRTHARDAGLFFLQMWAYLVAHELPYDDPKRLRRRLNIRYALQADRLLGFGELPTVRLQRALLPAGRPGRKDTFLTWIHWLWFLEPYFALLWILWRHPDRFPRSARQMAATFDLGSGIYALVPTAPPWWAAEEGYAGAPVRRVMFEVGEEFWGDAWEPMYEFLGGNPWAAMPSVHFATALMAALLLAEAGPAEGAAGWSYAVALGFALVYLGEHYLLDVIAGGALVVAIRRGEPLVEPAALSLSRALQQLERLTN